MAKAILTFEDRGDDDVAVCLEFDPPAESFEEMTNAHRFGYAAFAESQQLARENNYQPTDVEKLVTSTIQRKLEGGWLKKLVSRMRTDKGDE